MYLSQLLLDGRSRRNQERLGDCHRMHELVMSGFPAVATEQPRHELGVLYRVEQGAGGIIPVLVQSADEPTWAIEDPAVRTGVAKPLAQLAARFVPGARFRFRLRANPSKRVPVRALEDGRQSKNGPRVELVSDEACLEWLARRGASDGFEIISARVDARLPLLGRGNSGRQITVASRLFEGILLVRDPEAFGNAFTAGIGPGKAFGCGMLSLAPVAEP